MNNVERARRAWVEAATAAGGVRSPELDRLWREYLDALRQERQTRNRRWQFALRRDKEEKNG